MERSLLLLFLTCLQILGAVDYESGPKIQTQKTSFTEFSIHPTTTARIEPRNLRNTDGDDRNTGPNTGGDHWNTGRGYGRRNSCNETRDFCRPIVKECGPSLFRHLSRGGDSEDYRYKPDTDPCRCLIHCFDHSGRGCSSLTRKLEKMRQETQDNDSIFAQNHLGPVAGTFVVGVVIGILAALLIASVVKRSTCMNSRGEGSKSE